jgi:hypothetical protein
MSKKWIGVATYNRTPFGGIRKAILLERKKWVLIK